MQIFPLDHGCLVIHASASAPSFGTRTIGSQTPSDLCFGSRYDVPRVAWNKIFGEALKLVGREDGSVARPQFECSKKVLPLQAADLLAYETFKEVKNKYNDPDRKPSGALKALIDAHYHKGICIDSATMQFMLERRERGEPMPGALVPSIQLYESGRPLRG